MKKEQLILIENLIQDYMCEYGSYIITNRALPSEFDGLKPVHRRILFTMWLEKALKFTKSQNIDGQTLKIHPHGSVYGAMVNMVLKDRNNIPYIQGKGSFGLFTSKSIEPAAARYTEVKLSEFAKDMLGDTNKEIIEFIPNYDGTILVPTQLSTKIPTILLNPNSGIALGMGSSFGSFNINEISEAIIKYIETKEKTLLIPDFATKACIINNEQIFKDINNLGMGTIRLRAKYEIIDNAVEFTELPFDTKIEKIIEKIRSLAKTEKLKEVTQVLNLTGLKGLKLEVVCKKNTDMEVLVEKLFANTDLESAFSFNMNLINKEGLPIVKGVWDIIEDWIEWRKENIKKLNEYEIKKMQETLNHLLLVVKFIKDKDENISIVTNNKKSDVIKILMEKYSVDEQQIKKVLKIELFNLNTEYFEEKVKELKNMQKEIDKMTKIINNDDLKLQIIKNDIKEILEKYGHERRTKIITLNEKVKQKLKTVQKKKEQEIDNTPYILYITNDNYVKKLSKDCTPDLNKMKENDFIVKKVNVTNNSELLIFADTDCYKLNVKDIPECKPNEFGLFIKSALGLNEINSIGVLTDYYKYILIGYDNGQVAKIDMKSYITKSNRTKLAKSCLNNKMLFVIELTNDKDVLLKTDKKEYNFNTEKLLAKGKRDTKGSRIYNSEKETFETIEIL